MKLQAWVERIELNSACYYDGFRHFGPPIVHYYADGVEITEAEYLALLLPGVNEYHDTTTGKVWHRVALGDWHPLPLPTGGPVIAGTPAPVDDYLRMHHDSPFDQITELDINRGPTTP